MNLNFEKAGMEDIDKSKISQVVSNASKGSKYYARQEERQREIHLRISKMLDKLHTLKNEEIINAEHKMDRLAKHLESGRNLNEVIVHIDMDAFYAAVEMRDNPDLKNLPMAVGCMSMLSTSNYLARKFGVRAAMPGFIGKKLCPQLVIVEPNFEKYTRVSEEIRQVMAEYDENYHPMSLDEAYLEITDLVNSKCAHDCNKSREVISSEIVQEIRTKIFEKTNLTCSAGIAVNSRLAKVGSNMNKPNGQFYVPFSRTGVMNFISKLPIGKISGIGNVSQQMLNALNINVCEDLWNKRAVIFLLFSTISAESYLSISLGLGCTRFLNDDSRKSISVERTFNDTSNVLELKKKCKKLSELLSEDLKEREITGKVITLKLKTSTFHVKTKAQTLAFYTNDLEHISFAAEKLLEEEIKLVHPKQLVLRLMGVRISSLVDKGSTTKHQLTIESIFNKNKLVKKSRAVDDNGEKLNTICEDSTSAETTNWTCPVCSKSFAGNNSHVQNHHIDDCLSKQAVKEVLKESKVESSIKRLASTSPQSRNKRKKSDISKFTTKTLDEYFKS